MNILKTSLGLKSEKLRASESFKDFWCSNKKKLYSVKSFCVCSTVQNRTVHRGCRSFKGLPIILYTIVKLFLLCYLSVKLKTLKLKNTYNKIMSFTLPIWSKFLYVLTFNHSWLLLLLLFKSKSLKHKTNYAINTSHLLKYVNKKPKKIQKRKKSVVKPNTWTLKQNFNLLSDWFNERSIE